MQSLFYIIWPCCKITRFYCKAFLLIKIYNNHCIRKTMFVHYAQTLKSESFLSNGNHTIYTYNALQNLKEHLECFGKYWEWESVRYFFQVLVAVSTRGFYSECHKRFHLFQSSAFISQCPLELKFSFIMTISKNNRG